MPGLWCSDPWRGVVKNYDQQYKTVRAFAERD